MFLTKGTHAYEIPQYLLGLRPHAADPWATTLCALSFSLVPASKHRWKRKRRKVSTRLETLASRQEGEEEGSRRRYQVPGQLRRSCAARKGDSDSEHPDLVRLRQVDAEEVGCRQERSPNETDSRVWSRKPKAEQLEKEGKTASKEIAS